MKRASIFRRKFYGYLLKELLLLFFLSLAIFTFILVVSSLGKLADQVINKGVGLGDILLLVLYSSPKFLNFTLPMAFLLSSVVALGRLSSENEILALKASGINLRSLFVPVAILGFGVIVTGFLNSNLLLSRSSQAFHNTLANVIKKGFSIEDKEGIFNDSIKGVVIYIDKVDAKNKNLSGIVISDDRDEGIRQTITAEGGAVNMDTNTLDMSFQLKNGSLQRWEKSADAYRSLSFKDYTFSLNLGSLLPKEWRKRPYEMDIKELQTALLYAPADAKYNLIIEIYKKFSVPFSIVAFALLTVPLGITRRAEGKFSGVVYSLVIFISYYMLSAVFENVGKIYQISPLLVCFAPNIVFSLTGVCLLTGLNREGPGRIIERIRQLWGPYVAKAR
jgi:lipopolysaccharide export system permease protein